MPPILRRLPSDAFAPLPGQAVQGAFDPLPPAEEQRPLPMEPFEAGLHTGFAGMSGNKYMFDALKAEEAGDLATAQALRARGEELAQEQAAVQPRVRSLRDIGGVEDARQWAAYQIGATLPPMAPVLGSALLFRSRVPGSSFAGAVAPSYALNTDAAAAEQGRDPVIAAKSAAERIRAARLTGAAQAPLDALVPANLARGAVRDILPRAAGNLAVEGLTEGAQERIGVEAQNILNPARDRSEDRERIIEAMAAGAVGVSPFVGAGLARDTAYKAAVSASDRLHALRSPVRKTDEGLELAYGPQPDDVMHLSPERTAEALGAAYDGAAAKARKVADEILANEKVPEGVKNIIRSLNGRYDDDQAQRQVGLASVAARGADYAKQGGEALRGWLKDARDALGDSKKARMGPADTRLVSMLDGYVRPEMRGQEKVLELLPDIAEAISQAATDRSIPIDSLRDLIMHPQLAEVFKDQEQLFKHVAKAVKGANAGRYVASRSAEDDTRKPNSFIFGRLREDLRDKVTAPEFRALGRAIDDYFIEAYTDSPPRKEEATPQSDSLWRAIDTADRAKLVDDLTHYFGSKTSAKQVLDHYESFHLEHRAKYDTQLAEKTDKYDESGELRKNAKKKIPENEDLRRADEVRMHDPSRGMPFYGDERSALKQAFTEVGPGGKLKAVPAAEWAREQGDAFTRAGRLAQTYERRAKQLSRDIPYQEQQGQKGKAEQSKKRLDEYSKAAAQLRAELAKPIEQRSVDKMFENMHVVTVSEKQRDELVASDKDISAFRRLVDVGQTMRDKDKGNKIKETQVAFTVKRGEVNEVWTFSAEGMARHWAREKGLPLDSPADWFNAFDDAVASVLARSSEGEQIAIKRGYNPDPVIKRGDKDSEIRLSQRPKPEALDMAKRKRHYEDSDTEPTDVEELLYTKKDGEEVFRTVRKPKDQGLTGNLEEQDDRIEEAEEKVKPEYEEGLNELPPRHARAADKLTMGKALTPTMESGEVGRATAEPAKDSTREVISDDDNPNTRRATDKPSTGGRVVNIPVKRPVMPLGVKETPDAEKSILEILADVRKELNKVELNIAPERGPQDVRTGPIPRKRLPADSGKSGEVTRTLGEYELVRQYMKQLSARLAAAKRFDLAQKAEAFTGDNAEAIAFVEGLRQEFRSKKNQMMGRAKSVLIVKGEDGYEVHDAMSGESIEHGMEHIVGPSSLTEAQARKMAEDAGWEVVDSAINALPEDGLSRLAQEWRRLYDEDPIKNRARLKEIDAEIVQWKKDNPPNKYTDPKASFTFDPKKATHAVTVEEMKAAQEEINRILGPEAAVAFEKLAAGIAGEHQQRAKKGGGVYDDIRISDILPAAVSASEIAWHEAMHGIFARLTGEKSLRKARELLLEVANSPLMQSRLKEALKGFPEAQKAAATDREEALTYMFQMWSAGKLVVTPKVETYFQKVMKFLMDLLGIVTKHQKAEILFQSIKRGDWANPDEIGPALKALRGETMREKMDRLAAPLMATADKVFMSATDRLRTTGIPALQDLADKFAKETDRESGRLPFLQRREMMFGKFLNTASDIANTYTKAVQLDALEALQAHTQAKTAEGQQLQARLRGYMDQFYEYQTQKGVLTMKRNATTGKAVMSNGKPVWEPIPKRPDYFPQVWDKQAVAENTEKLVTALMTKSKEKFTRVEARAIVDAIKAGSGQLELAESEHDLGYSPFAQHVSRRRINWDPADAAHFLPFMEKDLTRTLGIYARQATHRAEYTQDFIKSDGSSRIEDSLAAAKNQGATAEELADARTAILALEGTLGHGMSSKAREIFSALLVYENMVLLPFALFSSLADPLGIAVRSGEMSDAFDAFKRGVAGMFKDIAQNKDPDAMEDLAKTMGLISDANMLDSMGELAGGTYMSKGLKRWNDAFFRWNGMEGWNRRMRTAGMLAGMRFILRHKARKGEHSERFMTELGLTKDMTPFIREMPDGRLAVTKEDFAKLGGKQPTKEELARLHEAVFRFVDGGVLRPNASHRPVWMSDPHWMLMAHLKQFTFSFQNTINKFVAKEVEHGNTAAALNMAAFVPWMIAVDVLQGGTTAGGAKASWGLGDYLTSGLERSSVLGNWNFGVDALQDAKRGNVPGASFLGPTAGHASTVLRWIAGDDRISTGKVLYRSIPAGRAVQSVLE